MIEGIPIAVTVIALTLTLWQFATRHRAYLGVVAVSGPEFDLINWVQLGHPDWAPPALLVTVKNWGEIPTDTASIKAKVEFKNEDFMPWYNPATGVSVRLTDTVFPGQDLQVRVEWPVQTIELYPEFKGRADIEVIYTSGAPRPFNWLLRRWLQRKSSSHWSYEISTGWVRITLGGSQPAET